MATIKDVAEMAGVSTTTVSLVMNGRAREKHISVATEKRVLDVVRTLDYYPALSARKLRNSSVRKPVLAFYWPLDYRTYMLGNLLSLIQMNITKLDFECELVVQTYLNDYIQDSCTPIIQNNFSGTIIGASSEKDIRFLESLSPQNPLLLINRDSNKYSTVACSSNKIGLLTASLLRQRSYSEVAIIKAERSYIAASQRTTAFIYACQQLGITSKNEWTYVGSNTISGGAMAAESYCATSDRPRIIFCESDAMVQGVLFTLHKHGLNFRQDVELISIGMQGEESMQYLIPSVTTVSVSIDRMIGSAVSTIVQQINEHNLEPVHIELEPTIYLRESFQL